MANTYRVAVGKSVRYRTAAGKFIRAKVMAVTSQTAVKLAVPRHTSDAFYATTPLSAAAGVAAQMTQLNSNLDVAKMTAHNQTNVWKAY